jgi:integrase
MTVPSSIGSESWTMIVRVKGVKKVRSKGHTYYYHRATNTRISAPHDSAEFVAEIARLDKLASEKPNYPADKKLAGTLGWLIAKYKDPSNAKWQQLEERTKTDYQKVFDYLQPLDAMPLAQLTGTVVKGIHEKTYEKHKRRFANYVLQVLRLLCNWAIPDHLTINPAMGIEIIARPKSLPKANRAWTDAECDIVLGEAEGGLKVAIALGMFACLRIDMVHRIAWTAYDGTSIVWQQKTDQENWLPAAVKLRSILDATPQVAITIVTSEQGRPYRKGGIAKAFRTLILRLEAEGKIAPGLTFHGLRHTAGKRLADLGADPRTIAAMLGHKSLKMAIHYSEEADRRRRASAAVAALEQDRNINVENHGPDFGKPHETGT